MSGAAAGGRGRVLSRLRLVGLLVAIGVAVVAIYPFGYRRPVATSSWLLLGTSFLLCLVCLRRVELASVARHPAARRVGPPRRDLGIFLSLCGAALWVYSTVVLYRDWVQNFDIAWAGWLAAAVLLGVGLDHAGGHWTSAPRRKRLVVFVPLVLVTLIAAVYRFWNIFEFPGPSGITQIEDLQFGMWGHNYLEGHRTRWEFIGHAWLSALGIRFGGNSMASVRVVYALVSTLTVAGMFVWLRLSAGKTAALVGSLLLAVSSWDVVVSRTPFNPDILIVVLGFALLAGPARSGRPSAYVGMGLLGGYILYEYIAYRPLAVFLVAGGVLVALRCRELNALGRLARPALTLAMIVCMAVPLFFSRLQKDGWTPYVDGVHRAYRSERYYRPDSSWETLARQGLARAGKTVGLFFFEGDYLHTRNVEGRPLVDPTTAILAAVGFAFAAVNLEVGLLGLLAGAFVLTTFGAMIMTGDYNPLRMAVTIPYVYFFAGLAGAALVELARRAWGSWGRAVALVCLAAAMVSGAVSNTAFLFRYWGSEQVRLEVRNHYAFLANWFRDNVRPGELVVGLAPQYTRALRANDAFWLRGDVEGEMYWTIESALRAWRQPRPTLFLVYAEGATAAVAEYFALSFPEHDVIFEPDDVGSDVAYFRAAEPPLRLEQVLANLECRGARVDYEILAGDESTVLDGTTSFVPFVDPTTWAVDWTSRAPRGRIRVRVRSRIATPEDGAAWTIAVKGRVPEALWTIDGFLAEGVGPDARVPSATLTPGVHDVEVVASFPAGSVNPTFRIVWRPEDGAEDSLELVPFYSQSVEKPGCVSGSRPVVQAGH